MTSKLSDLVGTKVRMNTTQAQRAEVDEIRRRRPDIERRTAPQTPPPVIVQLLESLGGLELCIRHEPWGVEVDARRAHSFARWQPVAHFGGTVEVRPS